MREKAPGAKAQLQRVRRAQQNRIGAAAIPGRYDDDVVLAAVLPYDIDVGSGQQRNIAGNHRQRAGSTLPAHFDGQFDRPGLTPSRPFIDDLKSPLRRQREGVRVRRHQGDAFDRRGLPHGREDVIEHGCGQGVAFSWRQERRQPDLRLGQILHRYQGIAHY